MMSQKLNCSPLLVKWITKLKDKKLKQDMLRIVKYCQFQYDYDGDGHYRHMTTTLITNPNMAGVWYTSTRQLYDDLMVRVKSARKIFTDKENEKLRKMRRRKEIEDAMNNINTTEYKGVTQVGDRYQSQIIINGIPKY